VAGIIKKEAAKYSNMSRKEFHDFILKLAGMSIKSQRYKHVPVEKIYDFG
jgi:hypothetical protein